MLEKKVIIGIANRVEITRRKGTWGQRLKVNMEPGSAGFECLVRSSELSLVTG